MECAARKLDQTFIHVASALYSYALSGIGLFAAGNAILHTWYIVKLWMPGPHDNAFERRMNVLMGTLLYTLPMVWRGDYLNFFKAFFVAGNIGSLAFIFSSRFNGWGHAVSHLAAAFFSHYLLLSAAQVPASLGAAIDSCFI